MENTRIFLSIALFTSFHLCYTAPENFLYDKKMAWAAEKIIERSKNNDAAVAHVKYGHIDEYTCNDATGQYRVQVDTHKKTVSIGWGATRQNFSFLLLVNPEEVLEQSKIFAQGGTVTKKYYLNNTVTKVWSKKSGETAYWSSAVLPLERYKELTEQERDKQERYAQFAAHVKPFIIFDVGVDFPIMHHKPLVIDGHAETFPHITQFMQYRPSRSRDELYGTMHTTALEPQYIPAYGLTKEESKRMAEEIVKDMDANRVPRLIGKPLADIILRARAEEIKKSKS